MGSSYTDPVNIGTEQEATILEWATLIRDKVEAMRDEGIIPPSCSSPIPAFTPALEESRELALPGAVTERPRTRRSEIVYTDAVVDDPPRRRPDITRAREELGWSPRWGIEVGIEETIKYFAAIEGDEA